MRRRATKGRPYGGCGSVKQTVEDAGSLQVRYVWWWLMVTFETASLVKRISLSLSLTRNPAPSKMEPPSQALCASSPKGRAKRRRATKGRPYGVWRGGWGENSDLWWKSECVRISFTPHPSRYATSMFCFAKLGCRLRHCSPTGEGFFLRCLRHCSHNVKYLWVILLKELRIRMLFFIKNLI